MADKFEMYCFECERLTAHNLMPRHQEGKLRITTVCAQCGATGRAKLMK